ncbi:hypothetical protein PUN28_015903 [Cardiocondyla obscurior]|uniref:Uncharacterized protein n=1 Tax=Cardiocondyla obscurior TaxID=286306 RepID=A0AAW2ETU8_9HYME
MKSTVVAGQTEIAVSPRNDPVLSCHILPCMLDRTVHYCRWNATQKNLNIDPDSSLISDGLNESKSVL